MTENRIAMKLRELADAYFEYTADDLRAVADELDSEGGASGSATEPDHLMHLVLTWAERGLLTMSDDWRNRRVLHLGRRVSEATEMAANNLYLQGLIMVTSASLLLPTASIRTTEAGRRQLAEWDVQVAGVAEPVAPTAHTPTCLDDQE